MAEATVPEHDAAAPDEERTPSTRDADRHLVPAVDIYETDDGLTLVADMPGVDRDSLSVNLEDNVLTIQGEVSHPERPSTTYREFDLLDYFRQFRLSSQIDTGQIRARLEHGVLTVSLPKAEKAKPKQIEVQTA